MFQSSERLSRRHQKAFYEAFISILHAISCFEEDDEIWPTQCDHAVASIQSLRKVTSDLYQLTNTSSQYLPPATDTRRNQLLIVLRSLEKLLSYDLLPYIKAFRPICQTSSVQMERQRQRIQYKLEVLRSESEDTLDILTKLIDQAPFEEKLAKIAL